MNENESIIKPLEPISKKCWTKIPPLPQWISLGYPACAWEHKNGFVVISAVEVANDKDAIDRGPEYHISISMLNRRCTSNEAAWVLKQFGMDGAEEDNHVPHGVVRHFWLPVAENLIGLECACKDQEAAVKEDKGDFIWRGF